MKVNIGKTKVMVSGKNCGAIEKMGSGYKLYVKRVLRITQCNVQVLWWMGPQAVHRFE